MYKRPFDFDSAWQKILIKAGFILDTTIKDAIFKNGEFQNELIFAIPGDQREDAKKHLMAQLKKHYSEWIRDGRREEDEEGDLEKAATFYEEAIRQKPLEELPFTRLMIIYRKLKEPGKELKTIDAGLRVFQDYYDQKPDKLIGSNSNAARLSKALLKSMNQNKKTTEPYYPEPIPSWLKRKETIEKKLTKKDSPKKRKK